MNIHSALLPINYDQNGPNKNKLYSILIKIVYILYCFLMIGFVIGFSNPASSYPFYNSKYSLCNDTIYVDINDNKCYDDCIDKYKDVDYCNDYYVNSNIYTNSYWYFLFIEGMLLIFSVSVTIYFFADSIINTKKLILGIISMIIIHIVGKGIPCIYMHELCNIHLIFQFSIYTFLLGTSFFATIFIIFENILYCYNH
jgi:hypothetical protein